jgi:hypothetical protein
MSVLPTIQELVTSSLTAALMEGEAERAARLSIGDYTVSITRAGGTPGDGAGLAAIFIQTGPSEFLVAGPSKWNPTRPVE